MNFTPIQTEENRDPNLGSLGQQHEYSDDNAKPSAIHKEESYERKLQPSQLKQVDNSEGYCSDNKGKLNIFKSKSQPQESVENLTNKQLRNKQASVPTTIKISKQMTSHFADDHTPCFKQGRVDEAMSNLSQG